MSLTLGTLSLLATTNSQNQDKFLLDVVPQEGKSPNKPKLRIVTQDGATKSTVSKLFAGSEIIPAGQNGMSYAAFAGHLDDYGDVVAIMYYASEGAIKRSDYSVAYFDNYDGSKTSLKKLTDAIAIHKGGF